MDEATLKEFERKASYISKSQLFFHTIQFLTKDNNSPNGYKPDGSGVLVKIESYYLIFTASHVTENIGEKHLYVNTRIGLMTVSGVCRETDLKMEKYTDLAYILLEEKLAKLLEETNVFLPLSKITNSHRPLIANNYLVCGYPEINIEIDLEQRTVYTGMESYLLTLANEKVFDFYKLDRDKNYALQFGGKGIDLETGDPGIKINDPYGISGCGLWFLKPNITDNKMTVEYFLIGIMMILKKDKYHLLIGNRIELIIAALEKYEGFQINW